jgi:hypothetical protein
MTIRAGVQHFTIHSQLNYLEQMYLKIYLQRTFIHHCHQKGTQTKRKQTRKQTDFLLMRCWCYWCFLRGLKMEKCNICQELITAYDASLCGHSSQGVWKQEVVAKSSALEMLH